MGKVVHVLIATAALASACGNSFTAANASDCAPGTERCACDVERACDAGLTCTAGECVPDSGGGGGSGGSSPGGGSGHGAEPGAAGHAGAPGGTAGAGAGGAGGSPGGSAGASSGGAGAGGSEGGSGGSDAGAGGAPGGSGGEPSTGGTGGGTGGAGGTGSADPTSGMGSDGCVASQMYLLDTTTTFWLFRPDVEDHEHEYLGRPSCGTTANPVSMAIDRRGVAWVSFEGAGI